MSKSAKNTVSLSRWPNWSRGANRTNEPIDAVSRRSEEAGVHRSPTDPQVPQHRSIDTFDVAPGKGEGEGSYANELPRICRRLPSSPVSKGEARCSVHVINRQLSNLCLLYRRVYTGCLTLYLLDFALRVRVVDEVTPQHPSY